MLKMIGSAGYGDIFPKTTIGRCYAMMWILIGINAYSYLTAAMTSASSLSIASIDDLKGLKLAAINGSVEHEVTFSLGVEVHAFKF